MAMIALTKESALGEDSIVAVGYWSGISLSTLCGIAAAGLALRRALTLDLAALKDDYRAIMVENDCFHQTRQAWRA
jgi:glycine/D-amino acid oxidase-like deaminating enzyme